MTTHKESYGAVRRTRNAIINRGQMIERIKPYTKESKAYIRGLEYALDIHSREFPDVI
jgi:hypothetical protein